MWTVKDRTAYNLEGTEGILDTFRLWTRVGKGWRNIAQRLI